ncbi:MAG: hypothetical protein HQL78_12355 [Magnetococcales bacterium]|nr:hypothetical protein [Magnetococcales bacterium]
MTHNKSSNKLTKLLIYWFVDYNPLYFFSALCVLAGVMLVSQNLGDLVGGNDGWARIILFWIVQSYEWLLIASAYLLFHIARQRRPGIILGLMAIFFLYDNTFRLENIADLETSGRLLTALWIILAVIKLWALAKTYHITLSPVLYGIMLSGTIGVGCLPMLLTLTAEKNKAVIFTLASWYGWGLLAILLLVRPPWDSLLPLNAWGRTVMNRCGRATLGIFTGFYFYHLWNHILWIGPHSDKVIIPQLIAPFLLLILTVKKDNVALVSGVVVMLAAFHVHTFFSLIALVVGICFGLRAWMKGPHWLALVAVLYFYLAGWTLGWTEGQNFPHAPGWYSWQTLTAETALLFLSWYLRLLPTPVIVAGAAITILVIGTKHFFATIMAFLTRFLPKTTAGWGVVLLSVGFLALIAGVLINWMVSKRTQPPIRDPLSQEQPSEEGGIINPTHSQEPPHG